MPFITLAEARDAARLYQHQVHETARDVVRKSASAADRGTKFDVFLSHSFRDAEIILGVYSLLKQGGLEPYVDWIHDPQCDRSAVTPDTADLLRRRMKQCGSLVYATSTNSPESKWMPWELGYFDGLRSRSISILPLVQGANDSVQGQEYLGLYPLMERVGRELFRRIPELSGRFRLERIP
jgi:hypothetical protein